MLLAVTPLVFLLTKVAPQKGTVMIE